MHTRKPERRKTESLLIAAKKLAIRKNYIKSKIDNTQQNNKCGLCGTRDDTVVHIMSECSKLAQKECKTRYDRVGMVIHWGLSEKLKFEYTIKWYMYKPDFVQENETQKVMFLPIQFNMSFFTFSFSVKQFYLTHSEAPVMELWRMWSTSSLPSLPGLLWPGEVASDRVKMGQIELFEI